MRLMDLGCSLVYYLVLYYFIIVLCTVRDMVHHGMLYIYALFMNDANTGQVSLGAWKSKTWIQKKRQAEIGNCHVKCPENVY